LGKEGGRQRVGATTADRGVATGSVSDRPSSSWLFPVGAGALVLALVVVLARGTMKPAAAESDALAAPTAGVEAERPSEPVKSAEPSPDLPPPIEPVSVSVRTVPEHATLRIDDGPPMSAPYRSEVPPDSRARVIRASAPGYVTATRELSFDQNRELVIELEREKRRVARAPRAKPKVARPPVKDPSQVETKPTGKRLRALDSDNPF
jgi:hypothetical protein